MGESPICPPRFADPVACGGSLCQPSAAPSVAASGLSARKSPAKWNARVVERPLALYPRGHPQIEARRRHSGTRTVRCQRALNKDAVWGRVQAREPCVVPRHDIPPTPRRLTSWQCGLAVQTTVQSD